MADYERDARRSLRRAARTVTGIARRTGPVPGTGRVIFGAWPCEQDSRTIGRMSWRDWVRDAEVEPSLYAADFARLGEQIDVLLRAGCRIFHFDVGDGHFVEPVTIGPVVLESIAPLVHEAGGVLDCHLMVDNPLRHFPQIARAGGDSVTFHYEVVDDVPATIAAARGHGLRPASRSTRRASPRTSPPSQPTPISFSA